MKFTKLDHIGIVVDDLAAAKAFFQDVGLEVQGEAEIEGGWVDEVVGFKGVKSAIVVMGTPDGGSNIELIKYYTPVDQAGIQPLPPNAFGLRNIAYQVDDIEAVVAHIESKGMSILGSIQQYEDFYKLCYIRGPEGIILMLAEALK